MNGKQEKFTSTWNPENQPAIGHAKRFYRKKFAPPSHRWAVSALTHYEISQSFDSPAGSTKYGQVFTAEWGLSCDVGTYWHVGFVGNYSQQTTVTYNNFNGNETEVYSGAPLQIGPEIKVTIPQCGFSAAFRYLHEMLHDGGNAGQYYPNVLALTLSQPF